MSYWDLIRLIKYLPKDEMYEYEKDKLIREFCYANNIDLNKIY